MEWQDAQDFCESMHESYLVEIFDQGTFTIYVTRLVVDSSALYRLLGPVAGRPPPALYSYCN